MKGAKKLNDEYAVRIRYGSGGITIFPYLDDDGEIREHRHASGVSLTADAVEALAEFLKPDDCHDCWKE